MTEAPSRGIRFSPTVVLVLVVLALAAGALVPWNFAGKSVPGTVRLGVLAAESPLRMERASGPLADWLAEGLGRSGEVVAPGTSGLAELERRCDVILVPEPQARRLDASRVLTWVRPVGRAGVREDFVLVRGAEATGAGLCAVAVEGVLDAAITAEFDSLIVARSPFAERELLRAFVSRAFDAVVVRGSVLEDARVAGWLADRPAQITTVVGDWPWMALVASPSLDEKARRRLRDGALNLDKFRLDPSHSRAAAVLHALAEIGIGGFASAEPFAALKP